MKFIVAMSLSGLLLVAAMAAAMASRSEGLLTGLLCAWVLSIALVGFASEEG